MDKESIDKGLDAVKALAETTQATIQAGTGVAKVLFAPFLPYLGAAKDNAEAFRLMNAIKLASRVKQFMKESGLEQPTRTLPPSFLIPLLESATLEEDESLQTLWAKLIANAANASHDMELRTSYTSMLSQMTSLDARNLSVLVEAFRVSKLDGYSMIQTGNLPDSAAQHLPSSEQPPPDVSDSVSLSLSNLTRLGCIAPDIGYGGGNNFNLVSVTVLGRAFYKACS